MRPRDHDYQKPAAGLGTSAVAWEKVGAALLLGAVFLLYTPAMSYQFVYDDPYQILSNSHVQSWRFLPVYFTQNVWSQIPNNGTNLYRPLFLVWLRLNYALSGVESADWHLTTVLMHVLVTGLVYLLACALLQKSAPALATAAVFGVHPVQVEATAWVSGVSEPLCGAFVLGSLLCYLRSRSPSKHRALWSALSLAFFGAGMLVKETATVLPLLIVAYEYTVGRAEDPTRRISARELRSALTPYAALLIAYLIVRTMAMHGPPHLGTVPLHASLLSWPWLLWVYIGLTFWPAHLGPLYDFTYVDRISSLHFLFPVAAIVLCLAVLWRWTRKTNSRLGILFAFWFLITLAPAMAQFCLADATQSYHDRYLYLPLAGLAMLIGAIVARLTSKNMPTNLMVYGAVAAVTVVLALSTLHQVRYWESNYTLFERASAVAPNNDLAAGNFTVELIKRREYRRALDLSETMIRLHPASERPLRSAAQASFLLHDFLKAEHYDTEATRLDPDDPKLWLALGSAQMKLARYAEAADSLQKAVTLDPQAPLLHYSLGFALAQLHDWRAAREQFLAELQINCECSSSATRRALQDVDSQLDARAVPSVWKSYGDGTVPVASRPQPSTSDE